MSITYIMLLECVSKYSIILKLLRKEDADYVIIVSDSYKVVSQMKVHQGLGVHITYPVLQLPTNETGHCLEP